MLPSYQLMRLPGDAEERFHLVVPFQPENRLNMVGWRWPRILIRRITGSSSRSPSPREGTSMARASSSRGSTPIRIYSEARTLLGTGGSEVQFGDLLTIPIEDSILYVLPMYVRAKQEAAVPELKLVMVVNGSSVSVATSLPEAIEDATGAGQDNEGETPQLAAAGPWTSRSSSCSHRRWSISRLPTRHCATVIWRHTNRNWSWLSRSSSVRTNWPPDPRAGPRPRLAASP